MDHIQQQQAWVTWLYQVRGGGVGGGGGGNLEYGQITGSRTGDKLGDVYSAARRSTSTSVGLIESHTQQHILYGMAKAQACLHVMHQVQCCLSQKQQHLVVIACHGSSTHAACITVTERRQIPSV